MKNRIVVGTRKSALAVWQAQWVIGRLEALNPDVEFEMRGIKTKGDKILDVALAKIGGKGLFTKELEAGLLDGSIDLAVHSMKDLPTELPKGLEVGAICERVNPADALVAAENIPIGQLPSGARVGTSSLRRSSQILNYRKDFRIVPLRGNVNTRLRKLKDENLDAIILAYAGLHRLGYEDHITQVLPFEICLPAVGQGSLGIETREDDEEVLSLIKGIDHPSSKAAIEAERSMLRCLEGGCQVPIGSHGRVVKGRLILDGVVASIDGTILISEQIEGNLGTPKILGEKLAERLLQRGAGDILRECKERFT
ncbi:MAG TPA: hydroxymethylbilane synthase [Clostridia bacterium]|nr:hydroxymethylbilane synthase [Clostridia bacterium]